MSIDESRKHHTIISCKIQQHVFVTLHLIWLKLKEAKYTWDMCGEGGM